MSKPENGGLDGDEAKLNFKTLCNEIDAICDQKGKKDKSKQWVAVLVSERILRRNQEARGHAYELREKENKNAIKEDIDKAEARIQYEGAVRGSAALSRSELARQMIHAAGSEESAFSQNMQRQSCNVLAVSRTWRAMARAKRMMPTPMKRS